MLVPHCLHLPVIPLILGGRQVPAPLAGRHPRRRVHLVRAEGLTGEALNRQRIFNNVAPVYDELNDTLSLGQHRAWKKLAVQWCGAKEKDTLLDVCCGSGDLAHLLAAAAGPEGLVQAVDFSPDMLAYAQQRPPDWTMRQQRSTRAPIEWTEGDALDLPFTDSQFDAATMGYGLRNVSDIPQALRELFRVLKPGGKASVLDFNNSESQLVRGVQEWALSNVVVPAAASYGLREEYEYLQPSIQRFPNGRRQEKLAREAGFAKAMHYEVGFGLMGVLVLTKD